MGMGLARKTSYLTLEKFVRLRVGEANSTKAFSDLLASSIMSLTAANAAIQIVAKAMDALNAVRERARTSKDSELKGHISALYDELLALKETVVRLSDENA